jgi:hypothetical protein
MNDGVALLLDRMKTNPEEFVGEGVYSKWSDLFSMYKDSLEPEDIQAFESARKTLIQEHFTQAVIKELVDPKTEKWGDPMPSIKSVPFNLVEHIEAHEKFLGQTPIAGVTQTL